MDNKMEKPKVYTEAEIRARWRKKKAGIDLLCENIRRLRYNMSAQLKSDNEKTRLTALAIMIMDKTAERVGNEMSAENGHIGITGLQKRNVRLMGHNMALSYVGKSGVYHYKTINDSRIVEALRQARKNTPSDYIFMTSDGFKIKSDRVNRILSDYGVTAKDLRGYAANKLVTQALDKTKPEDTESARKKQFNSVAKRVAEKIGHGLATLKKHYLLPQIETNFVLKGQKTNIND